jgi:hypothetical protein
MRGGREIALARLATSIVAGCAKLPEYREDAVSTADIVLNIKCELREAAWSDPRNQWVQTWNAGLILALEVTHSGGIDSDNTWVFPLNQGATFILGLTGGFSGQATRTERVNFKEKLTDLHNDKDLMCEREDPGRYARLGGRLGIDDLFARVGLMQKDARINPKQLDYNLDFVIKKNATTTPKFNLVPIGKEKTYTGSLKWTGSRGDKHSLKITLEPPDRPAPGCPVPLSFGKCPIPVYNVTPPPEPKEGLGPAARRAAPHARGGISPAESDSLDRAQSRNLLQSIDDQLRRQGIGN